MSLITTEGTLAVAHDDGELPGPSVARHAHGTGLSQPSRSIEDACHRGVDLATLLHSSVNDRFQAAAPVATARRTQGAPAFFNA
jgi:hypothetical protein